MITATSAEWYQSLWC